MKTRKIARIVNKKSSFDTATNLCLVVPHLPHHCELQLWFQVSKKLGFKTTVVTAEANRNELESVFDNWVGLKPDIQKKYLKSIDQDPTFLGRLDEALLGADIVVTWGESSLSSYQAMKNRTKYRWLVWQTAARPTFNVLPTLQGSAVDTDTNRALIRAQKTRDEVLANCDAIVSLDKDCASWIYTDGVSSQRIRRLNRGVDISKYRNDLSLENRIALRVSLGIPAADFVFFHVGALELESGCMDTLYAFKSMIQSHSHLLNHLKLLYCGSGSAGTLLRQAVVSLQLEDHCFFISPDQSNPNQTHSSHTSLLISICDAVVHNPIGPAPHHKGNRFDGSYDFLCAAASGITIISNGHGWIGDWVSRFYKTFAACNIHAQANCMFDVIDKQDKLVHLQKAARKCVENEHNMETTAEDLVTLLQSLSRVRSAESTLEKSLHNIERLIRSRLFTEAVDLISQTFQRENLSVVQTSLLHRHIADCFTKLGDSKSGLESYCQALTLDPQNAKAHLGIGTIALQSGDHEAAVPEFQFAIGLDPSDAMAYLGLALAFEGLGQKSDALKWAIRACHLEPENTAAIFCVVKLSNETKQFEQAQKILEVYVKKHPQDVNMIFSLAGVAAQNLDLNTTFFHIKNILAVDPDHQGALILMSQITKKSFQKIA